MSSTHDALAEAVLFAQGHEVPWPRDPHAAPGAEQVPWVVHGDNPPPFNRLRGPVHPRGPQSGVILQRGWEIAASGEPERADQTFSVAKTYLALLAGVAQGQRLLPDEEVPVASQLPGIGCDSEHNRHHLESSAYPDERMGRQLLRPARHGGPLAQGDARPAPPAGPKGAARPLRAPGTYWEYNDVRINQLALALLHLFRQSLPEVFLEHVLRPLGGGDGFAWEGYDDAWIELPSVGHVQSVPGGTHWGGGVSISANDQARIGQLLLDGGRHAGRQLIPKTWIERMATPCVIAPFCGRLLWLNRNGSNFPEASTQALFLVDAGGHYVWIEPARGAVVVLRWLDPEQAPAAIERIAAALNSRSHPTPPGSVSSA